MILLSIFDIIWIGAASFTVLFIIGLVYRCLWVNRFRNQCLNRVISQDDPLTGYFYINEEKYHFLLIDRVGEEIHIRYHDEEGEKTRRVHVSEVYPSLW